MIVGERLRELRIESKQSQGDIEEKTGLLRCYISRVENGHTVPAVETLEKLARALGVPMYRIFFNGDKPQAPKMFHKEEKLPIDSEEMKKLRPLLAKMSDRDRHLLLHTANTMARQSRSKRP